MAAPSTNVSIILAVQNETILLTQTLCSLLALTSNTWEAIVIDDGSTDDIESVVKHYTQQTHRIKYLKQSQQGLDIAKITGIKKAKYEFVLLMSAGDWLHEQQLASLKGVFPISYYQLLYNIVNDKEALLTLICKYSVDALLPKQTRIILARAALQNSVINFPVCIGPFYAQELEITETIPDIFPPYPAERLFLVVKMEGVKLGEIELPVCDGMVTGWVLKDTIASQFAWQILGKFFEHNLYQLEPNITHEDIARIHDQDGWEKFLQQIWGKPDLKNEQFYGFDYQDSTNTKELFCTTFPTIEVSEDLPTIYTETPEIDIAFTVGGKFSGITRLSVHDGKITPQALIAAITTAGNFELCRACVRESLIGRSLSHPISLRERLRQASLNHGNKEISTTNATTHTVILGRRAENLIGLSSSRRAALPFAAFKELVNMAETAHEPIFHVPQSEVQAGKIYYAPEIFDNNQHQPGALEINHSHKKVTSIFGRRHFEALFSRKPDPWKYTNPYEQTKYELTLSLLPEGQISKALELACAEGHFTEQLAPLVKTLVAADISKVALERAAARCEHFTHISYQQHDIVKDEVSDLYDLIVCSEVLYFVGNLQELEAVSEKFVKALSSGGHLLMAHAHQIIDEPDKPGFDWGLPFGAKVIGDTFAKSPYLHFVKEIRAPLYRIQLFQKQESTQSNSSEPTIEFIEQPTPVPSAVEASVRWNGGQPGSNLIQDNIDTRALPILMYHRVAPTGTENNRRYRVTPEQFEEQLQYLKDSGYYSATWDDWLTALTTRQPLPGRAIMLTFDDGYSDFYEHAWPLLKQYGFTATVFLVAGQIGQTNIWDWAYGEELSLMNWDMIQELSSSGIYFGAHSVTHLPLTSLSIEDAVRELAISRTILEGAINKKIKAFAYPYGATDEAIAHLAGACGYIAGLTCDSRLSTFKDNPMLLPRKEVRGTDNLQQFILNVEV